MNHSIDQIIASSALGWIVLNKLVTENQKPLEFDNHRYLIDPISDMHPDQVYRKSAQVGMSVAMIMKALWLCNYFKINIGYILPSQNIVKDFVAPKVDPLIASNPNVAKLVSKDSVTLKQIGDRFLYFRGAFSEREAIAISLDLLVLDELDRMPDMNIVNIYDSRLQASEYGWRWRLSNPSAIGFGVDALFTDSDQRHWFVKCDHCGHEWFIDFETDSQCHYVDKERQIYACGKCKGEISDEARRMGRWVAKYPKRYRHGYWMSQMIVPTVSARKILEQYEESSPDFFHNFVLGKAYTPSDLIVNRDTILRACSPSAITKTDVAMGVDNGVVKTWELWTIDGMFAHGQTESWEEIEKLMLMYNATTVFDPNPYPTTPKQLVDKYPNKAFLCYFKRDTKNLGIVQWGKGVNASVVYADRTKILDLVAQEIVDRKALFREHANQLEDVIGHWNNLYRTTVEEDDGRTVSTWMKKEGKQSDYPFAQVYARIALSRLMNRGESAFVEPPKGQQRALVATDDGYMADMSSDLSAAFEEAR